MTATVDKFAATRDALHQVAEHVLAAIQYAQTGDIRLGYLPRGFTTTAPLRGERRAMVIGSDLVVMDPVGRRSTPLSTVGAAAAFLGISPGLPRSAYQPATPLRPDEPLQIDAATATSLHNWYGLADAGLRAFATEVGAGRLRPVLWPEHFDLAIAVDAVNYGASPGDQHVEQPYLYVGPHGGPPSQDDFWNADFGAVVTIAEIPSPDAALAFFRRGHSRVAP
jgi:hypothetical protein